MVLSSDLAWLEVSVNDNIHVRVPHSPGCFVHEFLWNYAGREYETKADKSWRRAPKMVAPNVDIWLCNDPCCPAELWVRKDFITTFVNELADMISCDDQLPTPG